MIDFFLVLSVAVGIAVLLLLVLVVRLQAFLSLLIASIVVGLVAGMPATEIIESIQSGMGGTLGFVATVVGLGAIFGAILERSGGAQGIANYLLAKFGEDRAPTALVITGFVVAIPVFLDVAFIILVPIVYALQRKTGKSLLLYGMPLLGGLGITHTFIPPTPGPIAVAEIIGTDLGSVILIGLLAGIPTAVIAGPIFARYISRKIFVEVPEGVEEPDESKEMPPIGLIALIIFIPIGLIVLKTLVATMGGAGAIPPALLEAINLVGHPFSALIIANLIAWYFLGVRRGYSRGELLHISTDSLTSAGTIILLTGAGGAFKQLLVDTGAGAAIANAVAAAGMSHLVLAFVLAAIVRVLQGSATVAMITGAGLMAPIIDPGASNMDLALIVIAIASGATILSHVNDSGFWLVNRYLGLTEKQTLQSWTLLETVIGVSGLIFCLILSLFI